MLSIIIPTYKNKEILLKNLNHNLHFLKDCEIIIVNDNPEESLKNLLDKKVILIENKKNLGFGQTVNCGIAQATGKYVMLLNDDVKLVNNKYQSAINYFKKNKTLFALAFAQKEKDGTIVGKNQIYWQKGMLLHKRADNLISGNTAWAEGGACIIDREKFLKLGGFDPLYSPFYWEDIDLSYRALKAGYQIVFVREILVQHHHESTIGKYFEKKRIQKIAFRNQLIFHWKNITDKDLLIKHLISLPRYIFTPGFFDALLRLHKILQARKETVRLFKKTDREILELFISKLKS